jgi:hypothetical protein
VRPAGELGATAKPLPLLLLPRRLAEGDAVCTALAGVDPDELAFTGLLTETQYKARLADALGQPMAQAGEFMADMCGELDAELFAYVASLWPCYSTAILSDAIGGRAASTKRDTA